MNSRGRSQSVSLSVQAHQKNKQKSGTFANITNRPGKSKESYSMKWSIKYRWSWGNCLLEIIEIKYFPSRWLMTGTKVLR